MKLPFRVPSLDDIPEPLRECYQPDPAGGFRLQVDGVAPIAPADPTAPPKEKRKPVDTQREAIVARTLDRLGVLPGAREQAAESLRPLIRNDGTDDEPQLVFLHSRLGMRLPSGAPNQSWADELEFNSHVVDGLDAGKALFKREWLPAAAPPPKSAEQQWDDDSVTLPRLPKNIRLRPDYTQREFEEATRIAAERGGEVLFAKPVVEEPTLQFRPGRDVRIMSGCPQEEFEAAHALARKQKGEVVIAAAPAPEASTENDFLMGEGLAAMHSSRQGAYR